MSRSSKIREEVERPDFEVIDQSQPSSDGFPEGLLDQPFYGWVGRRTLLPARFNGLTSTLYQAEAGGEAR